MKASLVLALTLAACAPGIFRAPVRQPNYYSINADGSKSDTYSRINEWSSYGTHGLGAQSTIAAAYEQAQHAPPPSNRVDIYNASLPAGVTLEHGTVKIEKDAPYEAVGRFEIGYWKSSAPREAQVEPDLHRLAQVAQGDTIVVEIQRFDHADDRVEYMVGLVLRKRAAAPTAPAQTAAHAPTPRAHAQLRLVYEAPGAGCLGADEFADEVSAKLGYSPWQASGPVLRTEISRGKDGYHATLSLPGAAPKSLSGDSCSAVIDAAVMVVVVELDGRPGPTAAATPH